MKNNKKGLIDSFLAMLKILKKPEGAGFTTTCNKCGSGNVQTTRMEHYIKGEITVGGILLKCLACGEADHKEYEEIAVYG